MKTSWQDRLTRLHQQRRVDAFAFHFAGVAARPHANHDAVFLAAFLAAQHNAQTQHACLPESALQNARLDDFLGAEQQGHPDADVALPDNLFELIASDLPLALVLANGNLYLQRNWINEDVIAKWFRMDNPPRESGADIDRFLRPDKPLDDEQRRAVCAALSHRVSLITGGPGTGKTTLVALILLGRLLQNRDLRIRLCAPTGKAQLRMREALGDVLANFLHFADDDLPLRDKLARTPSFTIHRLLGYQPHTNTFRHNAASPLRVDLLVVDEVSMIDLSLMSALLAAIPRDATVIFLGDPDQLPAVETGAILADLDAAWADNPARAHLVHSHRFDPEKGIGLLKTAIQQGDESRAWQSLTSATHADAISLGEAVGSARELPGRIETLLASPELHDFRSYLRADSVGEAFKRFDTFRVLCATHHDVDAFNTAFANLFNLKSGAHGWPLMITRNDPVTNLFNGDIGLCWKNGDTLAAHFPDPDNPSSFRVLPIAQLPANDPAFAITIHKSQGSAFTRVLVVLPDASSPLLTRELLYTAVTRARHHCALWTPRAAFSAAVRNNTQRASGLADKLRA